MIYKNGRMVSSYSQIDKYLQCPYSWYLKYIEGNKSEQRSKHLEYGLAVHETLEYYFKKRKEDNEVSLDEMLDIYNLFFDMHDIPFDDEAERQKCYDEGVNCLKRLYIPINELDNLLAGDIKILGVEMDLDLPISVPEFEIVLPDGEIKKFSEVYIIGFIDLVLKTDEGIIVIDHKSGSTLFDKDKLAHNLQFPIYAMAVKKAFGVLPVRSYYNFTKLHKWQEVVVDEDRLIEAEKEIVKVFKKMGKTKHTAKPSYLCYWCDWSKYKEAICKFSSDFKPKSAK